MIIGLTGPVAAGKSTFAKELKQRWQSDGKAVEIVTTDSFLYPNAQLVAKSILNRKGFPESYDTDKLIYFLKSYKCGGNSGLEIPVYSHSTYDILPETRQVQLADVLIIEGVGLTDVVGWLDVLVYLSTDIEQAKCQYIRRTIQLIRNAEPNSHYAKFNKMPEDVLLNRIETTWKTVNLDNYYKNILPLRERADYVIAPRITSS